MRKAFFFGIIFEYFACYNIKLKQIMKIYMFISMLGLFTTFSSCDEDEIVETQIDFLFKETKCSNPWSNSQNVIDAEYLQEINYYLVTDLGVGYDSLYITGDGVAQDCEACFCLSGNIIRLSAEDEFSEVLLGVGFELD